MRQWIMVQRTAVIQHNPDLMQAFSIVEKELGRRLLDRLAFIKCRARHILNIDDGSGYFKQTLKENFTQADVINMTLSEGEPIPLDKHSMDFIFLNCILPWCAYPLDVLTEITSLLKPGGLLLLSSFGPDTFQELKCDTAFIDMHEYGDMLLHLGLESPVMDREVLSFNYQEDFSVTVEAIYGVGWAGAASSDDSLRPDNLQHFIDFVYQNEE